MLLRRLNFVYGFQGEARPKTAMLFLFRSYIRLFAFEIVASLYDFAINRNQLAESASSVVERKKKKIYVLAVDKRLTFVVICELFKDFKN
jgi:hypothetical protein